MNFQFEGHIMHL